MKHVCIFLLFNFFTTSLVISQEDKTNSLDIFENSDDLIELCLKENTSLELKKISTFSDENANGVPDVGETITYSFKVTNVGDKPIENILVKDDLLMITGRPIFLEPGESNEDVFAAVYTIKESDLNNIDSIADNAVVAGIDPENKFIINNVQDNLTDLTDKLYYQQYFR